MSPLGWGHRFLMCPPRFFGVLYEINPWMHTAVQADPARAAEQWESLAAALRAVGASIEVQPPVDGLPDLVFTANAGVVSGRRFVPAHFRHPERQGETAVDAAWFGERGYQVLSLPVELRHEGAGDALPFGEVLLSGYRSRSDIASHAELARLLGVAVRSVELVEPRLYHLDLVFCPLDERHALVAPLGLDRYGAKVVEGLVPEPILLTDEEALAFCANSVVVGDRIVMAHCTPRLETLLGGIGLEVVTVDVGEFLKAGGGARCLTLALDVTLGSGAGGADAGRARPG
ncbi:MAG TPA: arginine deiminase-related protein [Acidimicrobiales bacterium]|nr:arginine deiminase-related protein [Acidimicrobiales bacterium]